MITPAQSRAARALLNWTQSRLASEANVGLSTVKLFEASRTAPIANNLAAIETALTRAGVRFTVDGVALAPKL